MFFTTLFENLVGAKGFRRRTACHGQTSSRARRQLLFLLGWLMLSSPIQVWAAKNQLNLFIWSEYIDPAIVADFEKQFDCKVTIDLYEDESAMMAKLQAGGASAYD